MPTMCLESVLTHCLYLVAHLWTLGMLNLGILLVHLGKFHMDRAGLDSHQGAMAMAMFSRILLLLSTPVAYGLRDPSKIYSEGVNFAVGGTCIMPDTGGSPYVNAQIDQLQGRCIYKGPAWLCSFPVC